MRAEHVTWADEPTKDTALKRPRGSPRQMLSIVVPAYNEEGNVQMVYDRLRSTMDGIDIEWELIFSVDPCSDRTEELILALRSDDTRVKMLRFSRRFGQAMAMLAGLSAAAGDAAVVIDCDLQDPPDVLADEPQRQQLDAAVERHRDHDRRGAKRRAYDAGEPQH